MLTTTLLILSLFSSILTVTLRAQEPGGAIRLDPALDEIVSAAALSRTASEFDVW